MKEVIEHLERMAETLDGVDEENWLDTPQDIAQIYRSVANEIRQKMSAQNQSVTNCNQLEIREALKNIVHHFCANCPNNGPDGCELSKAEGLFEFLCHKLKQARVALLKPPRNCDRFYSFDEAQKRFLRETGRLIVTDEICDWLFAEAKGESNA